MILSESFKISIFLGRKVCPKSAESATSEETSSTDLCILKRNIYCQRKALHLPLTSESVQKRREAVRVGGKLGKRKSVELVVKDELSG